MCAQPESLIFEQIVNASARLVYRAFTQATTLKEWLCDIATVNPRTGGRIFVSWNAGFYACGEYTALEPEKRVEFTWYGRGYPEMTTVRVKIIPLQNQSQVILEHSGIEDKDEWKMFAGEIESGWRGSLENLASVLETGKDLRFVRRPMLGITIGDFDQEIAKKLGIPASEGVRLDDVVEGMGAKAAGLQKDDVIISLAGRTITSWETLSGALQSLKAGDEVEVIFYRRSEKKTLNMKLSGRSIPEIPDTSQKLANAYRNNQAEIRAEMNKLLDDVKEEISGKPPKPGEWSVKEVLAHLIHEERANIRWINDLLGGQEAHYDDYPGNLPTPIQATFKAYPTLIELRDEFDRKNLEIIFLLETLPVEFIENKGSYWRLAYNLLELPYHLQTHLEQMRVAIQPS